MIFYASTADQSSYLSLSMAESALILRAFPGGELTTGSFDRYNDSEWHVVIATREHNVLRLDIDDYKSYRVDVQKRAIPLDGPVFFGGVPDTYSIAAAASATDTNFYGCIGDATLNGRVVNFAQSTERPRALLQKCPIFKSTALFQTPSLEETRPSVTHPILRDRCALPWSQRQKKSTKPPGSDSILNSLVDITLVSYLTFAYEVNWCASFSLRHGQSIATA
ncbi:laminin subunit alpha-like [Macrobrachium nipponense]|uniref:laminin subunit alpha-like n=1 Tax=Macrobrachium nipponense TaxID=159736 RepID=UPI0030C8888F